MSLEPVARQWQPARLGQPDRALGAGGALLLLPRRRHWSAIGPSDNGDGWARVSRFGSAVYGDVPHDLVRRATVRRRPPGGKGVAIVARTVVHRARTDGPRWTTATMATRPAWSAGPGAGGRRRPCFGVRAWPGPRRTMLGGLRPRLGGRGAWWFWRGVGRRAGAVGEPGSDEPEPPTLRALGAYRTVCAGRGVGGGACEHAPYGGRGWRGEPRPTALGRRGCGASGRGKSCRGRRAWACCA